MNMNKYLDIAPEVQQALADGRPVVALESTIISHGMPYPKNVETALLVEQTLRDNGAVPATIAIRGGTDGARLSYEGLPCPNLFTGGENYHGRFEYVPVEDMEAAVRTLKCILRNAAK